MLIIWKENSIMLTPNGQDADKTDKIMLLAMWTNTLRNEREQSDNANARNLSFISAGMGKPTFPINQHTIQVHLAYWKNIELLAKAAINSTDEVKEQAVIGYGDPRGDDNPRHIMARAMSKWYGATIKSDNILFTVGGAGALRVIFETFNLLYKDMPGYRVVTPFPHYTLYADNRHLLHPIDVMKEPGYRLTAHSLQLSIDAAVILGTKDGRYPKVILLCNPNNPLGTIISEDELIKIAAVLRQYPDLHIVLDEAYAEMCFGGQKIPSFLTVAPDLMPRVIMMRSATKALSAAGERMAVLMAFDPNLMGKLLDKNIGTIGHAPRSAQLAYAETMAQFTEEDRQELTNFYQKKVDYVDFRLKAMGSAMPDPHYKVDGTFYILTDLSDLLGIELPEEARRALGKTGHVKTNEDLAYYLLFNEAIMLAPASYFGMSKENGFMRITCSGSEAELCDLMDRLELRLLMARKNKKILLLDGIAQKLEKLRELDGAVHAAITANLVTVLNMDENCRDLKGQNKLLQDIDGSLNVHLKKVSKEGRVEAAITIQSFYRARLARKEKSRISDEMDMEWERFVDKMVPQAGAMKSYFLRFTVVERLNLNPWKEHLKNRSIESDNNVAGVSLRSSPP